MGGHRRTAEEDLSEAVAALESARDRTLAAMAGSQCSLELAQGELDRTRETLRDLPDLMGPEPPTGS